MNSIKTMVAGIGFLVLAMCGYMIDPNGFSVALAFISFILGILLFFVGLFMKIEYDEPQPINDGNEQEEAESEDNYQDEQ